MELRCEDYGYDLIFNIKKPTGEVEDITGVQEVTLLVATQKTFRNILEGVCTVVDAANGKVKYSVKPEDFMKAGNYIGAIRIKYNANKTLTTGDVLMVIKEALNKD